MGFGCMREKGGGVRDKKSKNSRTGERDGGIEAAESIGASERRKHFLMLSHSKECKCVLTGNRRCFLDSKMKCRKSAVIVTVDDNHIDLLKMASADWHKKTRKVSRDKFEKWTEQAKHPVHPAGTTTTEILKIIPMIPREKISGSTITPISTMITAARTTTATTTANRCGSGHIVVYLPWYGLWCV